MSDQVLTMTEEEAAFFGKDDNPIGQKWRLISILNKRIKAAQQAAKWDEVKELRGYLKEAKALIQKRRLN